MRTLLSAAGGISSNADRKIATGESVRIVATDENSVVVVEPLK